MIFAFEPETESAKYRQVSSERTTHGCGFMEEFFPIQISESNQQNLKIPIHRKEIDI